MAVQGSGLCSLCLLRAVVMSPVVRLWPVAAGRKQAAAGLQVAADLAGSCPCQLPASERIRCSNTAHNAISDIFLYA